MIFFSPFFLFDDVAVWSIITGIADSPLILYFLQALYSVEMAKKGSDNVFSRMFGSGAGQKKESTFTTLSPSSDVFVRVALELLQNAPAVKRNEQLKNAIKSSFSNF